MKSQKAKVHVPKGSIHLYRQLLSNAYRKGFDEIHVTYESSEQMSALHRAIEELLGFEIIEMGKNSLTLKSVAVPDHKEFDTLFKRTFFTIKTAFEFLREDIKSGQFDAEKVLHLQRSLLKTCSFCRRILHKQGFPDITNAYAKYLLLVLNDNVISQIKYVYMGAANANTLSAKSIKYLDSIERSFSDMMNAILREDSERIKELTDRKYELYGLKERIAQDAPNADKKFVQELSILVRLIGDYLGPLCLLSLKEDKT